MNLQLLPQDAPSVYAMVAQLTEKEAKDELCYAYDVINNLRHQIGSACQCVDDFLSIETPREVKTTGKKSDRTDGSV